MDEWWKTRLSAFCEQAFSERAVIVFLQGLIKRVFGNFGLDQNRSPRRASAGSPGDLGQQGKEVLRGPEVGAVKQRVRIQHADQVEMRKIVSFCEYLRAYQDIDLLLLDLAPHGEPGVTPSRAVAIDAQHARR